MNETLIEQRLRRDVKKRGGKALKFISPGMRGVPDRLILLPGGKALFVELKAPCKKLEPLQRKREAELRALGFQVYKIDSGIDVDNFLVEVFK